MEKYNVRLTSPEIGGLWEIYIQEEITLCLLKYFLHHIKDEEIKVLLESSFAISESNLKQIKSIFSEENIPFPEGFSDKDVNLSAPPLFYDTFSMTLVYSIARMSMINTSFITCNVARSDVLDFFTNNVKAYTDLYKQSTTLMLNKGIYDRPPKIPYPKQVEFIQHKSYISDILNGKRPLNVLELTEIFFNVERNYFSIVLCQGLIQVMKDKEIKEYLKEGKKISEKQIKYFNGILLKEDFLGTIPLSMEVTDSTVSPFSDKFIVALFHFLNSIDITLIGHALSMSMRVDLTTHYSKFMGEILLYTGKGFNILVNRGWMEQPPQAPNRKKLGKS